MVWAPAGCVSESCGGSSDHRCQGRDPRHPAVSGLDTVTFKITEGCQHAAQVKSCWIRGTRPFLFQPQSSARPVSSWGMSLSPRPGINEAVLC